MKPCESAAELKRVRRQLRLAEAQLDDEQAWLQASQSSLRAALKANHEARSWAGALVKLRRQMKWAPGQDCGCQVCRAVDAVVGKDSKPGGIILP